MVNNETLDCMELNFTTGIDFLDYIEVDSANDITVLAKKIDWVTMRRDADAYVYRDYGVDHFGDFEHNFTLVFTDIEAGGAVSRDVMDVYRIGNGYGSMTDYHVMNSNYLRLLVKQTTSVDDKFNLRLHQVTGGVSDFADNSAIYNVRTLYVSVIRVGSDVDCYLYSDSDRNNLLEVLTSGASGSNTAYRYLQPITSRDQGTDPADHSTGYVEWDFDFGYAESGYYYTVEMIEGDLALAVLYNVTIPEDTTVTMEFSKDNNTWVDHNDVVGHDILTEGHEALDLRDLNTTSLYQRVNMTSDGSNTPRFLQNRIVTTTTQPTEGDGDSLFPGLAIGISLLIIASAYIIEKRR